MTEKEKRRFERILELYLKIRVIRWRNDDIFYGFSKGTSNFYFLKKGLNSRGTCEIKIFGQPYYWDILTRDI